MKVDMTTGYIPGGVSQSLVIEVYLPKNILNYGALIKLLTETIEFDNAHKWLKENWNKFYNNDTFLFKLDQHYEIYLEDGNISSELKDQFEQNGFFLSNHPVLKRDESDGDIYWLGIDNFEAYYINRKDLKVYKSSIWKANLVFIGENLDKSSTPLHFPRIKPHIILTERFRERIEGMEKTIYGYSIYEVDGAFEDKSKGRPLPSRLFTLGKENIEDIKNKRISEIRKIFKEKGYPLQDYLFSLNLEYRKYLIEGTVNDTLENVFKNENQKLSEHAEMKFMNAEESDERSEYWKITDFGDYKKGNGRKKEYALYSSDTEIKVYRIDIRIKKYKKAKQNLQILVGNTIYEIKEESDKHEKSNKEENKKFTVYKCIRIIEERTLVIRFLTNLEIRAGFPSIPIGGIDEKTKKERVDEKVLQNAYKKLWDTMTLIGQYFVYHLGSKVGIEDQIWISCNVGHLWIWRSGKVLKN